MSTYKVSATALGLLFLPLLTTSCVVVPLISYRSESDLRQKLLASTPKGTSRVKVLAYVLGTLKPWRYDADNRSVEQFRLTFHARPTAAEREISAEIGVYPDGFVASTIVTAIWEFDSEDRLSDIKILRESTGL